MSIFKLNNSISAIGVLNPNLRVFDIVMKTDYGTSYNAYLVKGKEKTALIETVHTDYFDEYLENIKVLSEDLKIDYVILNHTEPDHSGSLKKLLSIIPNLTVVVSQAGSIYLKNIVNAEFNVKVVKDNDEIDLGDKTLKFLGAPFLHWPDSMFTYVPEDNVLFSCDFLGCHYCEPRYLDRFVTYPDKFDDAFAYYYAAIFGPFKEYVLKGLDKIKDLNLRFICPSHGPILSDKTMAIAMEKYLKWSTPKDCKEKYIPIFFASAYGCTKSLAEQIAKGIASVSPAKVEVLNVLDYETCYLVEKLCVSTAFAVGSPTINKDAVFPIWALLSSVDAIINKGKPCAVFGSFGWSGEAVPQLVERLKGLKLNVFNEGFKACLVPSEKELEDAFTFGAEFGKSLN